VGVATELAPLLRSLVAILSRTPDGQRISYDLAVPDGVKLPFDRPDLAEALGNLLDNATRHAQSRVRIALPAGGGIGVAIEDDGPGIAQAARAQVMERGVRLDQRGEGAGLGLSIVQDVLEAYRWRLVLDASELGGLKAICRPAA
jgi:signal transduction histidine kinase